MQRRSAAPYAALAHPLAGVFPCRREDPTGKLAGSYLLAVIQMRTPARPLLVARRCLFAGRGTPAVGRSCGSGWRLPAAASRSCGHPADEADQSNRRRRCRSGVSLPAVSVRSGVYLPTSTQREKVELAASAVQIRRCRREALPAGSVRGPRSRLGEPFLSARARLGARSIPGSTGRRFGFGAPVRSPIETQQPGTRVRPIRSVGCTGRPGRVLARRPRDWLDQRRPLARSDGACASPARFPARGVGCTGPSVHPRRPRGGSNQSRPLARSDGAHASNCRVCAYKTALIPPLWPPLFPPPTCPPRELPAPPLACASGMASAEGSEVAELIAGNRKDAAKGNSSSGMACELLQWADTKPLDYVKHALELREAATTAGFLPFMCQGPEMPLVHTLEVNVFSKLKEKEKEATATKGYPAAVVQGPEVPLVHTLELKQANYLAAMRQGLQVHRTLELNTLKPAEYLASMRQGPETLTLIPCGLVRTIPRCLPQSIPKHVIAPGNLGTEDVEKTALWVQDKLKQKGGPEYCMRTIRATVEILKEDQKKALRRQSFLKKLKAGGDNTSRWYTFYSIGEKVLQLWDKYFPK